MKGVWSLCGPARQKHRGPEAATKAEGAIGAGHTEHARDLSAELARLWMHTHAPHSPLTPLTQAETHAEKCTSTLPCKHTDPCSQTRTTVHTKYTRFTSRPIFTLRNTDSCIEMHVHTFCIRCIPRRITFTPVCVYTHPHMHRRRTHTDRAHTAFTLDITDPHVQGEMRAHTYLCTHAQARHRHIHAEQIRSEYWKAKTPKLRSPSFLKQLRNETVVPFSTGAA